MDKKILRAYVIVLITVLAIALFVSVSFLFFPDIWQGEVVKEIHYYSSLPSALADATKKTNTQADCTEKKAANAAIYIYASGRSKVMLLQDIVLDEQCVIKNGEFEIDLNGKTLSFTGDIAAYFRISGGNIAIDGGGGSIVATGESAAAGLIIDAYTPTEVSVKYLNILATAAGTAVRGISCQQEGTVSLSLNNCHIKAISTNPNYAGNTAAVDIARKDTVVDLRIVGGSYTADSKYKLLNQAQDSIEGYALVCRSGTTSTIQNATFRGIHSGISNSGKMTVYNSYACSPCHGGIYNSGLLVMSETTVENSAYSGECTDKAEIEKVPRFGSMYNGSSNRETTAYIDGCHFINNAAYYGLVLSTNYQYLNCTAYISNCHIKNVRVDGEKEENPGQIGTLYVGKNVLYTIGIDDGVIDASTYATAVFDTEWLKENGIIS